MHLNNSDLLRSQVSGNNKNTDVQKNWVRPFCPQHTMIWLNRHGRIQNILATHGYENTDWSFNMVLCVFMVNQ